MKTRKFIISIFAAALCLCPATVMAQSKIVKDFKPVCDTLTAILHQNTGVYNKLVLKSVMKRGSTLDFYFTESLGDLPWRHDDPHIFKKILKDLFPEEYENYKVGEIYSRMVPLNRLVTPELGFDGTASETKLRVEDPGRNGAIVTPLKEVRYKQALEGRTIALWQSHGMYYAQAIDRWEWQRPCLFRTVEDVFTQSFVLPYLVPMLENAGAYVMLPRERDFRREEIIADNDSTWIDKGLSGAEYGYGVDSPSRTAGTYMECGSWADAGKGFADIKPVYSGTDNPFKFGTSRKAPAIPHDSKEEASQAVWTPKIEVPGEYAVYVSYKSLPESTTCAHYIVRHAGGESEFAVNQKMGSGMWVYLGTFPFDCSGEGCVILDARAPEGYAKEAGTVVCADAVKFGGGMGNIERGGSVSGMPRNSEAARYWLQWSGADSSLFYQNEGTNDYKDDYMSRGDWSAWLSGGSRINPKENGRNIPVDLTFGFHSDAGITPNDSIIGTLAIYTLKSEGRSNFPNKESRMASREFADMVQSQLVNDIRAVANPGWTRRQIWDRGYRESRTPTSPSMLLELLSHQNFADMKYGLDPDFRFTASRAIYKGMLKYLSNRYGCPYTVQPLPVGGMALTFGKVTNGKIEVKISWRETTDEIEPTAKADGFILYTRKDMGAFDNGCHIKDITKHGDRYSTVAEIEAGHIYSWKIEAYNKGGKSFPSEILSAGVPVSSTDEGTASIIKDNILIVNNFDRVGPPAVIDSPAYAGFDQGTDSGVGYIREISYIGDMYQFNRQSEYISNDNPGFGASFSNHAGYEVAGNSFDYPAIHGKAMMKNGKAFRSCSSEAFTDANMREGSKYADIICGKQVTTALGNGKQKYSIFPECFQEALTSFTEQGGNILISGAYLGTDIWSSIYPLEKDKEIQSRSMTFARKVLGIKWMGGHASRIGKIRAASDELLPKGTSMDFQTELNPDKYCVESVDGIGPASSNGNVLLRYSDSGISAAIGFQGKNYKVAAFGFPIETLKEEKDINMLIGAALDYLCRTEEKK